jgi:hypothetical protein
MKWQDIIFLMCERSETVKAVNIRKGMDKC